MQTSCSCSSTVGRKLAKKVPCLPPPFPHPSSVAGGVCLMGAVQLGIKVTFLPCFPSRVSWITTWETPRSLFCASCIISSASSGGCSDAMRHGALGLDDFFQKKTKKNKNNEEELAPEPGTLKPPSPPGRTMAG